MKKKLSKGTIAVYRSKARHGEQKYAKRLEELGISLEKGRAVGRPKLKTNELKETSLKKYYQIIIRNVKIEKEMFKNPFDYESKIFGRESRYYSVAELKKVAKETGTQKYYGYLESLSEYSKATSKEKFIKSRVEEIKDVWKSSIADGNEQNLIDDLTDEEIVGFYNSQYFVYNQHNELDSDGLALYRRVNEESVQVTRLREYLRSIGKEL